MNTDLRVGLVEVAGGLPTFASEGLEPRAEEIGRIAADAYDYIAGLLGFRPAAQVLVLSESDWRTKSQVPLYGLPNAGNGTLMVAGTEAPFWADLASMVGPEDRGALEAAYDFVDGRLQLGPFFDLVAVHEVAHIFHQDGMQFPRLWLQELFSNLCLHAWVEERSPASLATLLTLPRLASHAPAEGFECRTRAEFERVYLDMSGPNYVWFQFRLQMAAADIYRSSGVAPIRRLFDAFHLTDDELASKLRADVDPGLADFSLTF